MKRNLFLLSTIACILTTSCNNSNSGNNSKPTENNAQPVAEAPTPSAPTPVSSLYGSYTGAFGDNKITVTISSVHDGRVEGSSIVAGNDRPFEGKFTENNDDFTAEAKEPGTDAHDGVFSFSVSKNNTDRLYGTWKPYNKSLTSKDFVLERRTFKYIKDVGTYPEASQRLLTNEDVENLYEEDLKLMRNEIFARHGYCFKTKETRQLFDHEDWYIPASTDVTKNLTSIEQKNIALIKRYEKHAEEYGDEYGR